MLSMIDKERFKTMIEDLEKEMETEGYWEYTRENLDHFGITNKWFVSTVPYGFEKYYGEDRFLVWMTMVVYCFLSIYYARKEDKWK